MILWGKNNYQPYSIFTLQTFWHVKLHHFLEGIPPPQSLHGLPFGWWFQPPIYRNLPQIGDGKCKIFELPPRSLLLTHHIFTDFIERFPTKKTQPRVTISAANSSSIVPISVRSILTSMFSSSTWPGSNDLQWLFQTQSLDTRRILHETSASETLLATNVSLHPKCDMIRPRLFLFGHPANFIAMMMGDIFWHYWFHRVKLVIE